jgi:multiple sugar transport system permease protein
MSNEPDILPELKGVPHMKISSQKKTYWAAFFFVAPGVSFIFFLTLYPLGQAMWMSVFKVTSGSITFTGLANYQRAFQDNLFWLSLWNTLYFTVISVSLHFFIGLGLALLLYRLGKSIVSNILRGFLFLPWLFASAVWCVTWQLILHPYFSVLNALFNSLGLSRLSQPWLTDPSLLPLTVLSVVNGLKFFPFHMIMLFAALQAIPKELFEIADIYGASSLQKFRSVTWPFLKPITAIILSVDTIGTFYYFELVWIITKGGPMNKTEVLSTNIYRTVFELGSFEYGSSLAILLMIILLILVVVYMKIFLREEFE